MSVALGWLRDGWDWSNAWEKAYIKGFMNGASLERWEVAYVENVAMARARGVSA